MKKWLTACLLAIALLFVATTAMAGHTKANGEYCLGGSYALLKEYENQHLLRCNDCQEEILENHWIGQEATCIRKAQCGGCTKRMIAQVRAASYRGNVLYYIGKSVCCQAQICGKCNFFAKAVKKNKTHKLRRTCASWQG